MSNKKVTDTATDTARAGLETAVKATVSNNGGVGDAGLNTGFDGIETLRDTVINVVQTYPEFIKSAPFRCWKCLILQ